MPEILPLTEPTSGQQPEQAPTGAFHPLLMLLAEVAELLRVDRRTVERWNARSIIPGKITLPGGRAVRFQRDAVLKWIAEGCPRPAEKTSKGRRTNGG